MSVLKKPTTHVRTGYLFVRIGLSPGLDFLFLGFGFVINLDPVDRQL